MNSALAARVQGLVAAFEHIGRTRMAGVPVLNPALHVQAVGFAAQPCEGGEEGGALGVLITPWFMNLIWLAAPDTAAPPVGDTTLRRIGGEALEFIAAHDAATGPYELCSLYSPMFEFRDQASASAAAAAVLEALRQPPAPWPARAATGATPATPAQATPAPAPAPAPARRAFLFGRRRSGNAAAP